MTDFANPNPDTNAKRMINRWRLEKANPTAKLSPPKKQIVWYIEDNVPEEYRPYVQEGILEWNKAFEKIGFKDAIAVRWQNERDDFEPEDINYCTLRWITTGRTFAMSGLRSNPLTGEIIDGDVIFDTELDQATGRKSTRSSIGRAGADRPRTRRPTRPIDAVPLAVGEVISPIMARSRDMDSSLPPPGSRRAAACTAALLGQNGPMGAVGRGEGNVPLALDVVPAGWDPIQAHLQQRLSQGRMASCNYAAAKSHEMRFAALALALAATPTGQADDAKGHRPEEG